ANFLQKAGQQTEVFLRFSTVGGGQDSSDYARDPRGFACKFYTEEGNYDVVGNNTPVFFLNDPMKFPDFVHSQKKNPRSNLPDAGRIYEYWANHPQSLHQITILMSDRGIPLSWRHMNGYGSHTFSFWNNDGERFWFKWHFKTDQGVQSLTDDEAAKMPSHGAQQDLVDAIDSGDFPGWTVKVQVLSESEAAKLPFNPFDMTKVWPHSIAPLRTIGKLELNRNVENYFAETEQSAFAPSNFVPGIGPSPDKMLQARLMAYQDAHRYRMGANHNQIPVNAPRCPVHHYQRDGHMSGLAGSENQGSGVNFYPNDDAGLPQPNPAVKVPALAMSEGEIQVYSQDQEDYYSQAGELFRLMSKQEKLRLCETVAWGLNQASASAQARMLGYIGKADVDYAEGVAAYLTGNNR
ncbi:MAG: catalase, partial [Gammaproteobacteria bacterium]|nr:catalase [Gammaproteobacteria bacterium]